MKLSRRFALLSPLALAGCGGSSWFGGGEDAPLPGARKSVLLLEDPVRADPETANLPIALPQPRRNPDWPQTGGGPTHAMQHLQVGDTLRQAWRADIGDGAGSRARLLATPVILGNRVFTVDARGRVTAYAAGSGEELWRVALRDEGERRDRPAGAGLAVEASRLYVTLGSGTVLALSPDSGGEIWRSSLKAPVRAAPTLAGGRVLVHTADNQLLVLDAGSGDILWRHAGLFEQVGILGGASPAVSAGIVIAAYSSGEVFGLEFDSGRIIWSDTILRPRRTVAISAITDIIGDPVIDRDRVLAAGVGGEMVAFDVSRGDRIWTANISSTQTPWVAGEVAYLLSERNEVVCLLRSSGRVRWVSPLSLVVDEKDPESRRIRWSGPILASDRLLLASSDGSVISLSPYTGEALGRIKLPGPVSLSPVVADGTVYFLTDGAELIAYR